MTAGRSQVPRRIKMYFRRPCLCLCLAAALLLAAAMPASAAGIAAEVEALEARHGNDPLVLIARLDPLQGAARRAGGRDLAVFLAAWGYAHGVTQRPSVADAAITELEQIGRDSQDPLALALAYTLRASMLQFAGQLPAAAVWIERALPLARRSENLPLQYWALMSAADLGTLRGELAPSLAQFREAADVAAAQRNPRREAQARIAQVLPELALQHPAAALAGAERALVLARQAGDPGLELAARVLESLAAELAGAAARQLQAASSAQSLAAELERRGWGKAYSEVTMQAGGPHWLDSLLAARLELAGLLLGAGQAEQALAQARIAASQAHRQRDRGAAASASVQEGLALLGMGQDARGRAAAEAGLDQLRLLPGERAALLTWLNRYAAALERRGDLHGALARTREAVQIEAERTRGDRIDTVLDLQRRSSEQEHRRDVEALNHEIALQAAALRRQRSEVMLVTALLVASAIGVVVALWLLARVHRAKSQLAARQTELEFAVSHDRITGLPSRYQLERDIASAEAGPRRAFLGVGITIKRFGLIVGSLGHETGDRLLVQIAQRLTQVLAPLRGRLYRLDGLSFACIVAGHEDSEQALGLLARIAAAMESPFQLDHQDLLVTVSLGASRYPHDAASGAAVVRNIQLAVRDARSLPGNSYRLFDATLAQRERDLLQLEVRLAQALERGELRLHYQAQRDLRSGALIGFEALLRWSGPDGPISPADFIPLAEDSGLIVPMGHWVLRQACAQARAWSDAGLGAPVVAVNVSPRQFQHPGFLDSVRAALAGSGTDPAQIELEITEGAVVADPDATVNTLQSLREMGLQLAIDDFGTGHASLSYLRRFPLTRLKIDRSFVSALGDSSEDQAVVEAMIQLSHSLGLHVIAEGVEREEQAAMLRELGCDAMQGFLFARPCPAENATALLRRHAIVDSAAQ